MVGASEDASLSLSAFGREDLIALVWQPVESARPRARLSLRGDETARLWPSSDMEIVIWRDRAAATVDLDETRLCQQIEVLETDHPERRFVCAMCLYAYEVLTGVIPGGYEQEFAERYARTFLAPDWAFCDPSWPEVAVAEMYAIPLDQVAAGRMDWVHDDI